MNSINSVRTISEESVANLMTDLYRKVMNSEISLEMLERFVNAGDAFSKLDLNLRALSNKFEHVVTIKNLIVPDHYGTYNSLKFLSENTRSNLKFNKNKITPNNFGVVESSVSVGENLDCDLFRIKEGYKLTSFEITIFLTLIQRAIPLGLSGLSLLYPENKGVLDSEGYYYSFDYANRLHTYEDEKFSHIPGLRNKGGSFTFAMHHYVIDWEEPCYILAFRKSK